jgi:hypothetical protein
LSRNDGGSGVLHALGHGGHLARGPPSLKPIPLICQRHSRLKSGEVLRSGYIRNYASVAGNGRATAAWRAEPRCEIVRSEDENRESNPAPRVPFRSQRVCWTARRYRCPGRVVDGQQSWHMPPHPHEWAQNLTAGSNWFRGHKAGRSEGRRPRAAAISK